MSDKREQKIAKARVVLVGFEDDKKKYKVVKAMVKEMGLTFEEASQTADQAPVEMLELPIKAASVLARKLEEVGARMQVVPTSVSLGGGDTCTKHPHLLAVTKCKVCEQPLCGICVKEAKGKELCETHYEISRFKARVKIIFAVAAVLILATIWLVAGESILRALNRWAPLDTKNVALIIFSDKPTPETSKLVDRELFTSTSPTYQSGDQHKFLDLDAWFQKEFERLTLKTNVNILQISVFGPWLAAGEPPAFGMGGKDNVSLRKYLAKLIEDNEMPRKYDYYLFVYVTEESPFKEEYIEQLVETDGQYGIMAYPLDRAFSNDYYVMMLGNLISRLFGAGPKLDDKGFPLFPEGYASPAVSPRYPQFQAEIMGAYIPTKRFEIERVNSMDQVVIGAATAREMGWISKSKANDAYAAVK